MQATVITEADRARYNAAVASSSLADPMQSFEWGEVKRASGWDALRLLVTDDAGAVRAACSVLRTRPVRGVPPLLYAPRGPALGLDDPAALDVLVSAIRAHAGPAFMLKCDPPIDPGSPQVTALRDRAFRPVSGGAFGGVQPKTVMVLDLDGDASKVFDGFKSKWRYNIRLAERRGVTVRDGSREDVRAFYDILVETARRDGFVVRARTYFERLWDVLAPAGMLKVLLAEYDGRPIAGIMLFLMGERAMYVYGASSNVHRNVMPNHLLQWHGIRWACESGYRVYDFRGVSPVRDGEPTQPHIAGLNRFKEGFGARYVEYAGEFDLSLRAGWYAVWRYGAPRAMKLRRRLRGAGGGEAAE